MLSPSFHPRSRFTLEDNTRPNVSGPIAPRCKWFERPSTADLGNAERISTGREDGQC